MRRFQRAISAVGALWAATAPVQAQAPGLPVVNAGVSKGLTLGGMVGFPNDAAGGGTAFMMTGMIGFRRVALGGFVSSQKISGLPDRSYAGGGNVVVKVAGGPLVPISINLMGGFAYSEVALTPRLKAWHVPVGLGIAWTIPRPVVALKPWIAPRLDYRRNSGGGLGSVVSAATDFGLSGGVTFGFLNGLGIDVAFDRIFSDVAPKPTTLGVGLSYSLK